MKVISKQLRKIKKLINQITVLGINAKVVIS